MTEAVIFIAPLLLDVIDIVDIRDEIAKDLHLTDPYIYPKVCKNPIGKNWVEFVGSCMKTENNIFNIQHISVILDSDDIVGVSCVIPCGIKLCITDGIDNISEDFINNLNPVIKGYFQPLIDESISYHGYNITNICVDRDYRNKGLGHLLMEHCIDAYGSKIIHLDVIASKTSDTASTLPPKGISSPFNPL